MLTVPFASACSRDMVHELSVHCVLILGNRFHSFFLRDDAVPVSFFRAKRVDIPFVIWIACWQMIWQ